MRSISVLPRGVKFGVNVLGKKNIISLHVVRVKPLKYCRRKAIGEEVNRPTTTMGEVGPM